MKKTKTVNVKAAIDDNGYIKGYASTWTREPDFVGDADPRCRRAHEEIGGEFFSHIRLRQGYGGEQEHKEHKGGRVVVLDDRRRG